MPVLEKVGMQVDLLQTGLKVEQVNPRQYNNKVQILRNKDEAAFKILD